MKRLIFLLFAILLTLPALAEEAPSPADLAASLLPEYAFLDGVEFDGTAMFLVADAQGQTRFAGCVREVDGWRVTLSTAMPEGTWANTYHSYEGVMELGLPEGDSCTVALAADGRWLLCHTADTSISEDMLWFGVPGPYYGDVQLERDVTRIDWNALPRSYEDFLPFVDASRWAVVTGDGAPLYAEDGSVIAVYLPATPVRLLEAAEGRRRVAICGGSVTGWMEDADLLIGENQLCVSDETGDLAIVEDGFLWGAASFLCNEALPLYDAPEGAVIGETGFRIDLLARWPEGWLHVADSGSGLDGFIRADGASPLTEWLGELSEAYDVIE